MKTATQRVQEINAQTQAWIDAEPGRFAFMLADEAEHWEKYGVHTAEDLDRYMAIELYEDLFKEKYGFRARQNFDGYTAAEIQEWIREF
jgi:hypothetical protein